MPPMRAARLACALGCLLAVGAWSAGCGGGSGSSESTPTAAGAVRSRPAPPRSEFPKPEGKTLKTLLKEADSASELTVSPEAMVFYRGENRYPFGVFEHEGAEVPDAEVALYLARVPTAGKGSKAKSGQKAGVAQAQTQALEEPAIGPFPASTESLAVKPAFRTATSGEEPAPASVVYSTKLDFPSDGEWRIAALIREGDELGAALLPSAIVGEFHRVPRRGRKAPRIHAPGGQNKVEYAEVLGKRPIVLLFTTPEFCQSRVCGPVTDVASQAEHEFGDKAAFIQMDIYNHNDPGKGVRPQVRAFHLPSEPWLFTIDRSGDVSSAIEGALGPELMTEAVERVIAE
jgi:hypothetical protein